MSKNNILQGSLRSLLIPLLLCKLCNPVYSQTLTQAVQQALFFNPDVKAAIARRGASNERYRQARAENFPIIDTNAAIGREHSINPTATSLGDNGPWLTRSESQINMTEHVFAGFSIVNEMRRTRAETKADAFKIAGIANDVALDVTEQYLEVLRQEAIVKVAQLNIKTHTTIMGVIRERTGAGIDRESDLKQAIGRLDLAKANLVAEQSKLEDARVRFTRFVGIEPQNLVKPRIPSNHILPTSSKMGVAWALTYHPTLKSALADVQEALAQHDVSKGVNYPKVDLVGTVDRNRNLDGIKGDNNDELGMVRTSYTLFRGGKDLARQRETAYQVQEAINIKNRTILQVEETMRLSWNALINSQKRIIYLRGHVSSALATMRAYEEQFKVGKRSLFDLLDTQNEYFQSQLDLIAAQYEEIFARFRILNAMGKLTNYLCVPLPPEAYMGVTDNAQTLYFPE